CNSKPTVHGSQLQHHYTLPPYPCPPLRTSASLFASFSFFMYSYVDHRAPHSFPTRRSSDLSEARLNVDETGHNDQGERWWTWCLDRKSTRLNSSHEWISYAVFCLKKKKGKSLVTAHAVGGMGWQLEYALLSLDGDMVGSCTA